MGVYENKSDEFSQSKRNDEILNFMLSNNDILPNDNGGLNPTDGTPQFFNDQVFSSEYMYQEGDDYQPGSMAHNYTNSQFIIPAKDSVSSSENALLNDEERKKKTNREAQRAFRRRKEEKLKEMEQKWMNSENDKKELLEQIDMLKKATYEMSMENKELHKKILVSSSENTNNMSTSSSTSHTSLTYNFPDKTEYVQYIYAGSPHGDASQMKDIRYQTDDGEAMTVAKTWDYLSKQLQEKEQEGYTFDTWQIMSSMKGHEVCHGSGAAYMKSYVDSQISANLQEL